MDDIVAEGEEVEVEEGEGFVGVEGASADVVEEDDCDGTSIFVISSPSSASNAINEPT